MADPADFTFSHLALLLWRCKSASSLMPHQCWFSKPEKKSGKQQDERPGGQLVFVSQNRARKWALAEGVAHKVFLKN